MVSWRLRGTARRLRLRAAASPTVGLEAAALALVVGGGAAAAAKEQTRDGVRELVAPRAFGGAQLGQRAVQHLLRDAARERFQHCRNVLAVRERLAGARDLDRAPFVRLRMQCLDQGDRAALVEPVD